MFEFHIARTLRDRYQIRDVLFAFDGNAIFANPAGARALAQQMNEHRAASLPDGATAPRVNPGALFAMGLIDEAGHAVVEHYRQEIDPNVMEDALTYFSAQIGPDAVNGLLLDFVQNFPGTAVYNGEETPAEWLAGSTGGMTHRAAALEEMMMLWLANQNRAFAPFRELFDDTPLATATSYNALTAGLPAYFETKPRIGPDNLTLVELLFSVIDMDDADAVSDLLSSQLGRLRLRWGFAVGDLLRRLLLASDVLKEEEVALWLQYHPGGAGRPHGTGFQAGRGEVPNFTTAQEEYERFSPDQDWMPRTVLIAKSTYVWLHQLSRTYGREITRLDQIPDEELRILAQRGMNALWLIGVWERSRASQTIKRLCGNPDAVASAYSLYDYAIAQNLGGDWSYRNLRDRCERYGIRLASDMVPNHMGIDSTWVNNHPEWFLSRYDSPYPAYSFNGPDLSNDDRVEIKIEDHYYEQTDAAVVFRRRDKWTGDAQFIYHGNDGTSFPWNDTAQLNYLSAQVREQVIQTILSVARLFPIIRFDAAMTLAKRHIQRLWFPAPGAGGSIPSRAESSMTTEEFDAAIPHEFWREVVDRVAQEVPGTLLLAEAFWLMEGYFVRTLGMHRVYNSAFMVMLRDEDNANYRLVLKNTMEFDPGIMKRYVNFMSNPDEKTAIDQFGDGDKCFGVATLMATLPGLPMFGHGQIEGFTEKYGMEYYRPRFDEDARQELVERHEREIAPLLHRRDLFAGSENFLLYDFWHDSGSVDENVFAFSNRLGDQRALIIFHNTYGETSGTIHNSAAYMDKGRGELRQQSLEEALDLPNDYARIFSYRDNRTGLFHLRRAGDIVQKGIHFHLRAYDYAALLDWQERISTAQYPWDKLCDSLHGHGVPDLDNALINLELACVHEALRHALDRGLVKRLVKLVGTTAPAKDDTLEILVERGVLFLEEARKAYFERLAPEHVTEAVTEIATGTVTEDDTAQEEVSAAGPEVYAEAQHSNDEALLETRLREQLHALVHLPALEEHFTMPWSSEAHTILPTAPRNPVATALTALVSTVVHAVVPSHTPALPPESVVGTVLAWSLLTVLGESLDLAEPSGPALAVFDEFRLRAVLADAFSRLYIAGEDTWRAAARVRVALTDKATRFPDLWADGDIQWLAGVHESGGTTYFNKESFEQVVWMRSLPELMQIAAQAHPSSAAISAVESQIGQQLSDAAEAGYVLKHPEPLLAGDPEFDSEEDVPADLTETVTLDQATEVAEVEPEAESDADPLAEALIAVEPGAGTQKK
jgi:glycosidase